MATKLSFRVDDDDAASLREWATRLGLDRSELLRDALHAHLVRLSAEDDIGAWNRVPPSAGERALAEVAAWAPDQNWSAWSDARRLRGWRRRA